MSPISAPAEARKAAAIAAAQALLAAEDDAARPFLAQFYAHVAPADVLARSPRELADDALSLWRFARARNQGECKIRVLEGKPPARMIVETVNDDMPFLLDSLTAAIVGEKLTLHLAIHPIVAVRRDGGRLAVLLPRDTPGATHESMMRLEIADAGDAGRREQLADLLRTVLGDVRNVVQDWRKMRDAVAAAEADLAARPPPVPARDRDDTTAFLGWLRDDFFVFLGAREYRFVAGGEADIVAGSGLGILRDEHYSVFEGLRRFVDLGSYLHDFLAAPRIVEITRSNQRSRVLRPVPMDAIGVKLYDGAGKPVGLRVFLGLFTWHAYRADPRSVPLLAGKIERVLHRSGAEPGSHDHRALVHVIENLPRDELFQIGEDQLFELALGIRDLEQRPRLGLFIRRDPFGRFYSCFIFLPRERYRTLLGQRFAAILSEALGAEMENFHIDIDDQALARLMFFLRTEPKPDGVIDVDAIEKKLAAAARNWRDDLREALIAAKGEEAAAPLIAKYRGAFPSGYRERVSPEAALGDIAHIERVAAGAPFAIAFEPADGSSPNALIFKLFRPKAPMPLSDVLPLLEHLGLRVDAENPFEISLPGARVAYQQFTAESLAGPVEIARDAPRLEAAFAQILSGEAESDGFNRLLLAAGLDGRGVAIIRLYARFLRQTGTSFSLAYLEEVLARHGAIAGKLAAMFLKRFDPALHDGKIQSDGIAVEIEHALDSVASLDDDRILRQFLALIRHSLRTNFFQTENGRPKPYLAVKLASAELDLLPLPRPMVEIFVSSPWMEGVHLRNGKIARGGIRWSDRREDFRTEILGLMKAQVVKNAVIVPTGSKGGFVLRRPPADPKQIQSEAIRCYRTLLAGMLDLTDNVVGDAIVPPPDTVRYDGDDPYLVVAADKGTATFSDIANEISVARGYWLGDAFASGGSEGYDHKAMGITARGAWELVKRHFRERGADIQTTDFTVVGVGDMSGDVFGNGMLQSRHIRLVAAFDHRHIFLDPDPDPATSFTERERLFKLPRSSWADYDKSKISPGGGVFPRDQKSVPLSPEIRKRLGIATGALDPASLARAILTAPVDLLWFGGIGTFVKGANERHGDVGDRANDALRIDGREVRAPVIGEGANLGVTQKGRIEYALNGGRVDADSIDNSAGVDTSDREVVIKIALDALKLPPAERHAALHGLTDEVASLVLADNYAQGLALSIAEAARREQFEAEIRLMRDLERRKLLDRAVEFLPDDETLAARAKSGACFTRPELAVLLSFAKIALADLLLATDLPDDPECERDLFAYFPPSLVARYRRAVETHRLRREVIATVAANDLVNRGGIAFVNELMAESGRDAGDVARAFTVARGAFGLDKIWNDVCALDNQVPAATQTEMLLASHRLARVATGWLLRRKGKIDADALIAAYRPAIAALVPELAGKTPATLTEIVASLAFLDPALPIADLALALGKDVTATAKLFAATGTRLKLDRMIRAARNLQSQGLWESRAAESLIEEIYARQAELTRIAAAGDGALEQFLAQHKNAADRFLAILDETGAPNLAQLLVAAQALAALTGA